MSTRVRVLLVLLALLSAGCPGAGDAPREQPALLRLWQPMEGLQPTVFAPTDAPSAARTLWRTRFDGQDDRPWHALVAAPEGVEGLRFRPVTLADGKVVLRRSQGWAVVASVPVLGGQAVSVRVVARAQGPVAADAPVSVAAVLERREAFDPQVQLSPQDVADFVDPRRTACHVLSGPLAGASRSTLLADFVTDRGTTELAVHLLAPLSDTPHALVVESVQVDAVPLARHVAGGGEFPGLQHLGDPTLPAVRVALDRDEREGLLAWPGERLAFPLPPCAQPQRLDLSLGVAPRDPGIPGAVTLAVRLAPEGGPTQTLLERRRTAPAEAAAAAWADEAVELPPLPRGGTLSFACAGEGADPPLAVFGHPTLSRSRPVAPPNVVLISLDTLRPDHLGCYGGDAALTPRLDALAASGLRFANAYSTSSYTLPSHASLLTGQWPALHGAVDIADRLDPARSPFLARLLAQAGWVTAAFTGGGYVSTEYGFGEGFDRYSINDPVWAVDSLRGQQLLRTMGWERTPQQAALLSRYAAPAVVDWLERRAGGPPFFVFLHTYVVHNYAPDLAALQRHGLLAPDGSQQPFNHQDRNAFNEGRASGPDAREKVVEQYLPYYDATVGMADDFVGQVLDALDRTGLAAGTLVIVTSDHGEEFGEHDFFGHGETLYEAAVRVPLLVRLPAGVAGPPPGSVLEAPVSLADVAPWILGLCGQPADPRMFTERPLGPDTLSPPGRRRLYIELDTHRARLSVVRDGDLKLHALLSGSSPGQEPGERRLFDVADDPLETRDLGASRAGERSALDALLEEFHLLTEAVHARGPGGPPDLSRLSPEMIESLRALGYLGPDR